MAELLTELPQDVDVEGMMTRTLISGGSLVPNATAPAGQAGGVSQAGGGGGGHSLRMGKLPT